MGMEGEVEKSQEVIEMMFMARVIYFIQDYERSRSPERRKKKCRTKLSEFDAKESFSIRSFLRLLDTSTYDKNATMTQVWKRLPVLFFSNNVYEYVKFVHHTWRISMESMTMTKDLQIIMEANFILVLSILGAACINIISPGYKLYL